MSAERITSTEVEVIRGTNVPAVTGGGDSVPALFAKAASELIVAPDDLAMAIAGRQMAAATIEEVFAELRTEPMRNHIGTPVDVRDFVLTEGAFETGFGLYAIVQANNVETGARMTLTCGALSVMVQLVRLWQLHALPIVVVPSQSDKPTRRGQFPMHLALPRQEEDF